MLPEYRNWESDITRSRTFKCKGRIFQ